MKSLMALLVMVIGLGACTQGPVINARVPANAPEMTTRTAEEYAAQFNKIEKYVSVLQTNAGSLVLKDQNKEAHCKIVEGTESLIIHALLPKATATHFECQKSLLETKNAFNCSAKIDKDPAHDNRFFQCTTGSSGRVGTIEDCEFGYVVTTDEEIKVVKATVQFLNNSEKNELSLASTTYDCASTVTK